MNEPHPADPLSQDAPLPRERVAALLLRNRDRYAALIRRRIRGKLAADLDIDDLLSSAFRRIDELAAQRRLRACAPDQLRALTIAIARNLALARARSRRPYPPQAAGNAAPPAPLTEADRDARSLISRMAACLSDPTDVELFFLRLHGCPLRGIALACGKTEAAIRKRWVRLRQRFQHRWRDPCSV